MYENSVTSLKKQINVKKEFHNLELQMNNVNIDLLYHRKLFIFFYLISLMKSICKIFQNSLQTILNRNSFPLKIVVYISCFPKERANILLLPAIKEVFFFFFFFFFFLFRTIPISF